MRPIIFVDMHWSVNVVQVHGSLSISSIIKPDKTHRVILISTAIFQIITVISIHWQTIIIRCDLPQRYRLRRKIYTYIWISCVCHVDIYHFRQIESYFGIYTAHVQVVLALNYDLQDLQRWYMTHLWKLADVDASCSRPPGSLFIGKHQSNMFAQHHVIWDPDW